MEDGGGCNGTGRGVRAGWWRWGGTEQSAAPPDVPLVALEEAEIDPETPVSQLGEAAAQWICDASIERFDEIATEALLRPLFCGWYVESRDWSGEFDVVGACEVAFDECVAEAELTRTDGPCPLLTHGDCEARVGDYEACQAWKLQSWIDYTDDFTCAAVTDPPPWVAPEVCVAVDELCPGLLDLSEFDRL